MKSLTPVKGWAKMVILFVCLVFFLFGVYHPPLRIFHSYGDVTIAGEGQQTLTYDWHSWPLSSEGSLTCHTYCDTGLYNDRLREPVTLTPVAERLAMEMSLPVIRLRFVAAGIRTHNLLRGGVGRGHYPNALQERFVFSEEATSLMHCVGTISKHRIKSGELLHKLLHIYFVESL